MKIVFMGTPDYAAGALKALINAGHEITAVVTQPDKPKGRSSELLAPPVKVCALEHGLTVLQPVRIKTPEAIESLRQYPADVYIVAAFGQILSREILDIPPLGCINIHASLLPKYRGASPIQHAIMDGEEKTGITIMQMDAGIDTGDMLYKKEIGIEAGDTYESLYHRLTNLGGLAITEALALLEEGKLTPRKQQDELSSYAPLISKSMGEIDFAKGALTIDRIIRAMTPWPGAFTSYRGKQLKIWRAAPDMTVNGQAQAAENRREGRPLPGEILAVEKESVLVAAGEGAIRICELQLEGKKRMATRDFLPGAKMQPGELLGKQCEKNF